MLPDAMVYFGATPALDVTFLTSDYLTVTVPPADVGGTVDLIVDNMNGEADTLQNGFFYGHTAPIILLPLNGTELLPNGFLIWTQSFDAEFTGIVGYHLQLDDNPDFSTPEIDEGVGNSAPLLHVGKDAKKVLLKTMQNGEADAEFERAVKILRVDQDSDFRRDIEVKGAALNISMNIDGNGKSNGKSKIFFDKPIRDEENQSSKLFELLYNLKMDPNLTTSNSAFVVRLNELTQFDSLADNTVYYWRVSAVDDFGVESDWTDGSHNFFFNLENTPPGEVVSGFNPSDSSAVATLTPTISWNAAADPDLSDNSETLSYTLQVSVSPIFADTLYENNTDPGITSVKVIELADDAIFFYRLRTWDDEGLFSGWSAIQAFVTNTALDPPSDFSLLSPTDGVDSVDALVMFEWESSTDKDFGDYVAYTLYYGPNADLTGPETVLENVGTETSYSVSTSLSDGRYYWKVRGTDTDSLETWASNSDESPWHFWIGAIVGVKDERVLPDEYNLSQNYPNPFNPVTVIEYELPKSSDVNLVIYNLRGQEVAVLASEDQKAGYHKVSWDASNMASGVYLYRLQAGDFVQTRKMILLK